MNTLTFLPCTVNFGRFYRAHHHLVYAIQIGLLSAMKRKMHRINKKTVWENLREIKSEKELSRKYNSPQSFNRVKMFKFFPLRKFHVYPLVPFFFKSMFHENAKMWNLYKKSAASNALVLVLLKYRNGCCQQLHPFKFEIELHALVLELMQTLCSTLISCVPRTKLSFPIFSFCFYFRWVKFESTRIILYSHRCVKKTHCNIFLR